MRVFRLCVAFPMSVRTLQCVCVCVCVCMCVWCGVCGVCVCVCVCVTVYVGGQPILNFHTYVEAIGFVFSRVFV